MEEPEKMMGYKFQNTEYDKAVNKSKQQEDDCELRIVIWLWAKKFYWYLGLMQHREYEQKTQGDK